MKNILLLLTLFASNVAGESLCEGITFYQKGKRIQASPEFSLLAAPFEMVFRMEPGKDILYNTSLSPANVEYFKSQDEIPFRVRDGCCGAEYNGSNAAQNDSLFLQDRGGQIVFYEHEAEHRCNSVEKSGETILCRKKIMKLQLFYTDTPGSPNWKWFQYKTIYILTFSKKRKETPDTKKACAMSIHLVPEK